VLGNYLKGAWNTVRGGITKARDAIHHGLNKALPIAEKIHTWAKPFINKIPAYGPAISDIAGRVINGMRHVRDFTANPSVQKGIELANKILPHGQLRDQINKTLRPTGAVPSAIPNGPPPRISEAHGPPNRIM
jgi:hypothetical protein